MRFNKFIAILISIISFLLVSSYAGDASEITYSNSTQIVLNTSSTGANTGSDLKELAVLIKLDKSNFDFDVIKENLAGNINFSTSDGSFLSYKIQTWDKTNKTAEIWIIVPKVFGNNNSQFITLSWGKIKGTISDQKLKDRIEEKESHEISNATSANTDSSLFKSSYEIYGVWSSNAEKGFSIIGG